MKGARTMSIPKLGDVINGFICLGDDPKLLEAIAAIKNEGRENPRTDKERADQERHRELVSSFADQAVASAAGQIAFPEWAQQLQQTRHHPHEPTAPDDTASAFDLHQATK
jgi:hypothetical protein